MRTNEEKYLKMKETLDRFFSEKSAQDNMNDYALCYSTLGIIHDITTGIYPTDEVVE